MPVGPLLGPAGPADWDGVVPLPAGKLDFGGAAPEEDGAPADADDDGVTEPPRYQLAASSPKHSPTVTAALMVRFLFP